MKLIDIERGDTVKFNSKESEYDGHEGVVYQIYDEYAVLKLENTDGITVAAPWGYLEPVEE